jgi:hypothetical protein
MTKAGAEKSGNLKKISTKCRIFLSSRDFPSLMYGASAQR